MRNLHPFMKARTSIPNSTSIKAGRVTILFLIFVYLFGQFSLKTLHHHSHSEYTSEHHHNLADLTKENNFTCLSSSYLINKQQLSTDDSCDACQFEITNQHFIAPTNLLLVNEEKRFYPNQLIFSLPKQAHYFFSVRGPPIS